MYDLLVEISSYLPSEGINLIYEKISEIQNENINEFVLNLIKGFSINALIKLTENSK